MLTLCAHEVAEHLVAFSHLLWALPAKIFFSSLHYLVTEVDFCRDRVDFLNHTVDDLGVIDPFFDIFVSRINF